MSAKERGAEPSVVTRMGDGSAVRMTRDELRREIEDGVAAAVRRGGVPPLAEDAQAHLLDLFASPARFTAVDIGHEVVLTYDGTGSPQQGGRVDALVQYEQLLGADSCELYHVDYVYRAVKTVVPYEQQAMKEAQERVVIPVHYGAQPDLGRYSQPDGPVPNWSMLLPELRIQEAREAQEEAVALAVEDIVHVAEALWEAGADAIDLDTSAAAGDAEFLAALLAVERLRKAHPEMGIIVGMAGEIVLGMHGEVEYRGRRLAGLKPAGQLEAVQEAGATVFGPAVNVDTGRSVAWNVARALTFLKPCCEAARIPVHVNVGMGVGGVPMAPFPPLDAVARVSRACVDVLRVDGL